VPSEFEDQFGDDPEMSRLLRERLTRHPAPAHLRSAILRAASPASERPRWWSWGAPALSALATALIMLMVMTPALPRSQYPDPLQSLASAVITEHARTVFWGGGEPEAVPAVLPSVMEETGVVMSLVFTGDDQIRLIQAKPTYVEGHRSMSLAYMTAGGHVVTYMIMPGGSVALPDRGRVQIDRWRPMVRKENGFSMIMWKQQGLLCVLVSDLVSDQDLDLLKAYFVKVRSSTELHPFS
jgi:anti-sigma factor RsiW